VIFTSGQGKTETVELPGSIPGWFQFQASANHVSWLETSLLPISRGMETSAAMTHTSDACAGSKFASARSGGQRERCRRTSCGVATVTPGVCAMQSCRMTLGKGQNNNKPVATSSSTKAGCSARESSGKIPLHGAHQLPFRAGVHNTSRRATCSKDTGGNCRACPYC
jgi:hypothetical protein